MITSDWLSPNPMDIANPLSMIKKIHRMKIGDQIGKYIVEDFIGEGGMGAVYKVQNQEDGQSYALKICKEKDDKSIRRFNREVRIQENINHQNIVKILDRDLNCPEPYFVMLLAQHSLNDISASICGDINKVYSIFKEICNGITAVHLSGNYHRDIKPSNVLIYSNGTIQVSDFGLAKMVTKDSSSHSSSNGFIGTVGYHAPEQIQGKNADTRTDVFQLGKTFYQMFTCDYPHLINPKLLPPGLSYIIQKSTLHDPNNRYQSVSDLRQAIDTFIQALDPTKNPVKAIESKLFEIDKMQKSGFYDEDVYISFLDLLGSQTSDINLFLTYFDQIPEQTLKVYSNKLSDRFLPFLKTYSDVLKQFFEKNHVRFGYAEDVADKMLIIFDSTNNLEIKSEALINSLRVSHWLNRFNAMDTFDFMLQQIKDDDEAAFVAQALNSDFDIYKDHADRIADQNLHPAIVEVKNKTKSSSRPDAPKTPDWLQDLLR